MRRRPFGAALTAAALTALTLTTLTLATPALAQRDGGGNNDSGAGLASGLQAGNDRTAGVRAGAGRVYGGYPDGYYGAYYGTRDPGPYGADRGGRGSSRYP